MCYQNDGTRLADESTLLITDMVVQLEDGSIANLEIQKIGYYFPGEKAHVIRQICSLRQYKRARESKESGSLTEISSRYIRSCYLKKKSNRIPEIFQ